VSDADYTVGQQSALAGFVLPERYRIVANLVGGSQGQVVQLHDQKMRRFVALKVLQAAHDPVVRRRFRAEVDALLMLAGHPNVVSLYDYDEDDGRLLLYFEFCDGGSLVGGRRLPAPDVVRIGRQAAAGLAAAHAAGIVHRDIKPSNLLVGDNGIKVADFGIAALSDEMRATRAGTDRYTAPEVLAGAPATPASDVYSLGKTLLELAGGDEHQLRAVGDPAATRTDTGPPAGTTALRGLLANMLAAEPAGRPDARTVAESLAKPDALSVPIAGSRTVVPSDERKIVSMLCCDLDVVTSAETPTDPEDERARLSPWLRIVDEKIRTFGGTVIGPTVGNRVVAVFGAPVTHEDDAERAVRAGLSIAADGPQMRIGIDTGEALIEVSSVVGTPTRPIGAVVSTAARIAAAAPLGAVAVGQTAFLATTRAFDYDDLQPAPTGAETQGQLWRAVRARPRPDPDVARSRRTAMVGREHDLALLISLFEKAAEERTTQFVTVIGEPGVGKSRLVQEFRRYVESRDDQVVWRRGRCLPYGDGITFWALGEIVKAHAGIDDADTALQVTDKLDAVLFEPDRRTWLRARLLPLVGIEAGSAATRDESFAAWRLFLESLADPLPAVVVVEDIHWADPAMREFLDYLADASSDLPLLVVCTARPELTGQRTGGSAGLHAGATIRLRPLSDGDLTMVLDELLAETALPTDALAAVLERADGNPLYAEEFAQMLVDLNLLDASGHLAVGAQMQLPVGLQALISARLDTLPPEHKQLIRDAAVIGKTFAVDALCGLAERVETDVLVVLRELAARELVRPLRRSSTTGRDEYCFWHSVIRDVAYAQLPRAKRASRHIAAADWLADNAGERPETCAEVIAHHLTTATDLARAAGDDAFADRLRPKVRDYTLMAADKALNIDPGNALQLLDRVRSMTEEDDPLYPGVLLRWGTAALSAGRFADAAVALRDAAEGYRSVGETRNAATAMTRLSNAQFRLAQPSLASAETAVRLLESLPPGHELVDALGRYAEAHRIAGDDEQALAITDRALLVARKAGLSLPPSVLAPRGCARVWLGDPGGVADLEAALAALQPHGDSRDVAVTWALLGMFRWLIAGPERGLPTIAEAEAFIDSRGLVNEKRAMRGARLSMMLELGYLDRIVTDAGALIPELEAVGDAYDLADATAVLALALAEQGNPDARSLAERAMEIAAAIPDEADAYLLSVAAAVTARLHTGDHEAVRTLLTQVVHRPALGPEYGPRLLPLVRGAIESQAGAVAAQLATRITSNLPVGEHAQVSARALLAEARGAHDDAEAAFVDAGNRWAAFGNHIEHAHAVFGQGRCQLALGHPGALSTLEQAKKLFDCMGMRPRIQEVDALIDKAVRVVRSSPS